MSSPRARALIIVAVLAARAVGQDGPPSAVLGEPIIPQRIVDPTIDPLLRPLGPPDQPFRPFAPLGPPTNPLCEGIGTRFGLGVLSAQYGLPGIGTMWIPSEAVLNQPANLGMWRADASLFAPIAYDGPDSAAVGLGVRGSFYSTDAILPDSLQEFPDQLWDVQGGVAYSHTWDNGWTTGAVVSGGSASDRPFYQGNTLVASLVMYTAFPTVDHDAWLLGFSYIPTSDFPYPLPIASYYWEPNEDFSVNIGLPFFLKYRVTERATFDFFYVPIRNIATRLTWQPIDFPNIRLYGAYNWANEAYFLANRQNDSDRFYGYEMRLTGGLQFDLPWRLQLDMSAGYVFNRFYFLGKSYNDNQNDRIDVGSGIFGALQLRLKF